MTLVEETWRNVGFAVRPKEFPKIDAHGNPEVGPDGAPIMETYPTIMWIPEPGRIVYIPLAKPETKDKLVTQLMGGIVIPSGKVPGI
jgi:hypothetical protein